MFTAHNVQASYRGSPCTGSVPQFTPKKAIGIFEHTAIKFTWTSDPGPFSESAKTTARRAEFFSPIARCRSGKKIHFLCSLPAPLNFYPVKPFYIFCLTGACKRQPSGFNWGASACPVKCLPYRMFTLLNAFFYSTRA
jgi:hypothetical protein